jgi:hypothetical protein
MLHFARAFHAALLECCIQPWPVGDKSSRGCGAFARCSRNQQNLTGLIGIFYQRKSRERFTGLPAWRGWYIRGRFLGTRTFIADEFLLAVGSNTNRESSWSPNNADQGLERGLPRKTKLSSVARS